MKVLHVIDSLGVGGGAEHSLAAILPLLRDRGVESTIATIRPRGFGLEVSLAEQGFPVEVLPETSWPGRALALRRKIRSERPDIVHSTLFNSCMIARFACIGLTPPLINTLASSSYDPARVEGIGTAPWKMKVVMAADGFTGRHLADHIHAVTESVRSEGTDRLRFDPAKISVIPRGRSLDKLGEPSPERRRATRERLGIADEVPVVLNIARQVHAKAHADLIRAFRHVLDDKPNTILLLAGREGDATDEVLRALDEVDAGESIRLLGHRDDVPDLLVAADIFVFPSLYEGMAGSILEAMAMGAPVIGADAVAIAEVLDHGRFGPVVPRGDVAALGAAIIELLDNPQRRAELGEAGRAHFLSTYRIETVADAVVEMYRTLL